VSRSVIIIQALNGCSILINTHVFTSERFAGVLMENSLPGFAKNDFVYQLVKPDDHSMNRGNHYFPGE